mmetsp:Transcript_14314/g.38839  ORF Transcript_14314/g.38839 Transcript_14314/m.38839 type:complete len:242 (-) Transcript_14314:125-850(-)
MRAMRKPRQLRGQRPGVRTRGVVHLRRGKGVDEYFTVGVQEESLARDHLVGGLVKKIIAPTSDAQSRRAPKLGVSEIPRKSDDAHRAPILEAAYAVVGHLEQIGEESGKGTTHRVSRHRHALHLLPPARIRPILAKDVDTQPREEHLERAHNVELVAARLAWEAGELAIVEEVVRIDPASKHVCAQLYERADVGATECDEEEILTELTHGGPIGVGEEGRGGLANGSLVGAACRPVHALPS